MRSIGIFRICTLIMFINSFAIYGQTCKDFHKSNDCYVYVPLDRSFAIYNQAKSMQVKALIPMVYKVVLYGKKDYIIGVCAEASYYRKIRLRIIDGINKKVLFDNKDFDYIESFSISTTKTQPLEMEVTVLTKEKAGSKSLVCLGFQILYATQVGQKEKQQ